MAREQKTKSPNLLPDAHRPPCQWYIKVGPPGTGKTEWIKRQVERAVQAYGPDRVLLMSFSNGAVSELGKRIALEWDQIGTIHAHAYRSIGRPKITETPKARADWNNFVLNGDQACSPDELGGLFNLHVTDEYYEDGSSRAYYNGGAEWATLSSLSREASDDFDDPAEYKAGEAPADPIYSRYQVLSARMIPREEWDLECLEWATLWEWWKDARQLVDFADILQVAIMHTDRAFNDPNIIFIDEAQDLSRHQWELIKLWAAKALKVIIVGDPDQNLYAWSGTDPDAFYSLGVPAENISVLAQSWRVPVAVHDWSVRWISATPGRVAVDYRPTSHQGEVDNIAGTIANPAPFIDRVEEWLADPDLLARAERDNVPNAVPVAMILCTCSYMLAPILAELRKRGLKYFNPYRRNRGDWNLPSLASQRRVLNYLHNTFAGHLTGPTYKQVWDWLELIDSKHLKHGYKKLMGDLSDGDVGLQVMPDQEWFEAFGDQWAEASSGDLQWLRDHLLESKAPSLAHAINIAEQRGPQALLAPAQIVVGTYYSVKGGSALKVIMCPDLSPAAHKELDSPEGEAAARRLFYVGATRAVDGLYLAGRGSALAIDWGW